MAAYHSNFSKTRTKNIFSRKVRIEKSQKFTNFLNIYGTKAVNELFK